MIFLNRFYWPDEPATGQLLADLAEELVGLGCDVTVIASHPGGIDVLDSETHCGVKIQRIRSSRRTGASLLGKATDFGTFFFGALWRLLRLTRRGDAVVAMTDPPLLGIGAWLVAGVRGARLFHWVQDIYPELAIELTGQRWLAVIRPLRDLAWRRADACVTLGHAMAGVLTAHGVAEERAQVVPNWAPTGLAAQPADVGALLRSEWGLTGRFVVAYAGNLGRVHDLEPVLGVAGALRSNTGIAFVFVGNGPQRAALESEAARRGLLNVHFRPPQPRARLASLLAVGDVHLVTLRSGCERLVFPSKLYGAAAAGRPVIFIGPRGCEITSLLRDYKFGRAFARNETSALASYVSTLALDPAECKRLGAAALRFAGTVSASAAATRWHRLLDPAEACCPPPEIYVS